MGVILWAKLRMSSHTIASIRDESKLKILVVSVSAILLWLGAYALFYGGFRWIRMFGSGVGGTDVLNVGEIVMVRMLSVFALALFFMLIFSNILIAFSTMYRSREMAFLIQSPIGWRSLFTARFIECISFSSWASAFLGSPLILAYGLVMKVSPLFYLAAVLFYLPFVTLPAAIGAIITLVLARVFPSLNKNASVSLTAIAGIAFFFFVRARLNAVRLSEDTFLPTVFNAMEQTQSPWLPSYWASQGVLSAADGRYSLCVFNFLLLLSNALMASWLAMELANILFYPGWSVLIGQDRARFKPLGQGILGRLDFWLKRLWNPYRALVIKDLKLFWRDTAQWSQFVIFFGLMAIYIATLRNDPSSRDQDLWRGWITSLNSATCMLVLSTLTSRFVFPLISLEGRRFWILGLAPLTYSQLMWQKFWLSVMTTSTFTLGLVILTCIRLQVEPLAFFLAIYSTVAANFGLAGLAVGLGSLYPNFQEDNSARIVSGMGGTLNFLLSMAYIVLVAAAQTIILQWRVLERLASAGTQIQAAMVAVVFITILSIAATFIPMRLGRRNLENAEY